MSAALGVAIVGCGNIAGRYAEDLARRTHVRLVGAADLDGARAAAFAAEHGVRAYVDVDEALADPEVAVVANLTSHRAHVPVTTAALDAGRHVFSEKPMAPTVAEARALVERARQRGLHLAAAPIVGLGELAQTARRWIDDGRLGTPRLAFADVNWGRIESWHPDPAGFYAVGPLVDVGIYPVTLVTAVLGPVRRVTAAAHRLLPERSTLRGERFEIGAPDCIIAVLELTSGLVARLTANFYVADPARQRGVEVHGDEGSLWLSNWSQFDGTLEHAPRGEPYRPVRLLRQPAVPMPWAAGLDEMAAAALDGRPSALVPEAALHVIDVIETVQRAAAAGTALDVQTSMERPSPPSWTDGLALAD